MSKQYTISAARISLVAFLMTIQFVLNGLLMPPTASAQQPAGQQVFVPSAIKSVANNKPAEEVSLMKSRADVAPIIKSRRVMKPLLRLTPRNSFVSTATFKAYWYFYDVAFFTPHHYDDDGVALFGKPADGNGVQMVLRFSGKPNQAYAVDVTLGIPGHPTKNQYRVVCVVDGAPGPPQEFKVGPKAIEHLLFDLAPSTSGEYMVTISSIPKDFDAWWYFLSLEVAEAEMVP